jgi:signal transduction histidine kinase
VAALLSDGEQSETLFLVSPSGYSMAGESDLGVRRDHPNIAQAMGEVSNRSSGTEQGDSGFVTFNGEGGVVQTAAFSDTDGWTLLWIEESERFFIYGSTFADRAMSDTPTRTAIVWAVLAFLPILAIVYIQNRRENQASMKAEEISHAFLAITGHELRTPLTSLRGFSQMLAGRWDTIPDEQKKEMIATISRHARTLEHLIERLLLGGQLEAGIASPLMERTMDARKALLDAVEQFDGLSPVHQVTLEAPEELSISADPKAFGQVMSHLLENALKYSPSGGDVWVKARKNGKWVEISVEDEGVGLPSDTSRMFEKFGQTEAVNTRTVEEGGVGLGLFIVRRHLEAMGGKVRAERRDPKGARFIVVVRSA